MSLHTRLRLLLAIVLLALFFFNGISNYRAAHREQELAMEEQAERARAILMSMRRIYHQQFINSGLELAPETLGFLPAHAMNRISTDLSSWIKEGFSFNNVSDFPRNPAQAADAHELQVMEFFRANPTEKVYFEKFKDKEGSQWFQYARPIWIEEYCLKCHGVKSETPMAIQNAYDTAYDYKLGDLRGLLSIRLSAEAVEERHRANILENITTSLLLFIVSFLILSYLIHRYVNRPISNLVQHVNQVAQGANGIQVSLFSGDFSILADSVNDMAQKIEEDRLTLLANEETYRNLVEGTNAAPWSLDVQTRRYIYLGSQFESILGFSTEDIPDFPAWAAKIHPDDRSRAVEVFENTVLARKSHQQEYRMISSSNKEVWVKCVATIIPDLDGMKMIGFLVEITDQKNAEQERTALERKVMQAQKMESLGVLAGGVAHDFNNLLLGIIGHADLALMDLDAHEPARADLDAIIVASQRAADLAKQMLAYSGKGKFIIDKIHLGDLVREMVHLLHVSIANNVELSITCSENLPLLEGDATQIRQIVMNLITNAAEALGDENGEVSLTVGEIFCQGNCVKSLSHSELSEGLYVSLVVSDTGSGMDEETLQKIFDPFYSTKFTGRGLGLAAVQGIVRGHNGAIKAQSELGRGTTFKVFLPALAADSLPNEQISRSSEDQWSGSGTVMVVDDDPIVRDMVGRMLESLGLQMMFAEDGLVALDLFHKHGQGIDCVLLDLTMPRMSGKQVFLEIRQLSSDVPVVMSSGYNEEDVVQEFDGKGIAGFIQKPYKLSDLKEILQKILG